MLLMQRVMLRNWVKHCMMMDHGGLEVDGTRQMGYLQDLTVITLHALPVCDGRTDKQTCCLSLNCTIA